MKTHSIDARDLQDEKWEDVLVLEIIHEDGNKAKVFVDVRMVHGRPKVRLTALKGNLKETKATVTANWLEPNPYARPEA